MTGMNQVKKKNEQLQPDNDKEIADTKVAKDEAEDLPNLLVEKQKAAETEQANFKKDSEPKKVDMTGLSFTDLNAC